MKNIIEWFIKTTEDLKGLTHICKRKCRNMLISNVKKLFWLERSLEWDLVL